MTSLPEVGLASRVALAAAAVLGTCVLLAACGSVAAPSNSGGGSGGGASNSATSTPAGSAPAVETPAASSAPPSQATATATAKIVLDVMFAATTTSPARSYTLFCEPAGGTTPDPAAACAKLLAGDNIFAPRPVHDMCAMALAGGGRATVTGTYFGRPEHMIIVDGGCELVRWTELKAIFG